MLVLSLPLLLSHLLGHPIFCRTATLLPDLIMCKLRIFPRIKKYQNSLLLYRYRSGTCYRQVQILISTESSSFQTALHSSITQKHCPVSLRKCLIRKLLANVQLPLVMRRNPWLTSTYALQCKHLIHSPVTVLTYLHSYKHC